jgi:hypothetical protein
MLGRYSNHIENIGHRARCRPLSRATYADLRLLSVKRGCSGGQGEGASACVGHGMRCPPDTSKGVGLLFLNSVSQRQNSFHRAQ